MISVAGRSTPAAPFAIARRPVPENTHAQRLATETARDEELSVYDTLDEGFFRLEQVTQNPSSGYIECRTKHFLLQDPPPYSAVSYACGSRPARYKLKLNGRDWYIRTNLSRFLRHRVQMPSTSGEWLWIDAICINQENPAERTHQVRLMASIYGKASLAIIWLGPAYEDSDAAMRGLLKSKADEWPLETLPWILALGGLCSRRYWRRLWCLQEMKLAKTKDIMCGSMVIPWTQFDKFLTRLGWSTLDRIAPSGRVHYVYDSAAMRMIKMLPFSLSTSLWQLLDRTAHLRSEEAKDKAYALFGLVDPAAARIQPDYNLDMSAFLNTILKYHIEHELIPDGHPYLPPDRITLPNVGEYCEKLESLFRVKPGTIFLLGDSASHLSKPDLIYRRLCTQSTVLPGMSLLWAIHYDHHPRVQELMKLAYRRGSLSSHILSGACFAGSVAAIPFVIRNKSLAGFIAVAILVVMAIFSLLFTFVTLLMIRDARTGKWTERSDSCYLYQDPSHTWRTLTLGPFVLGELWMHYAAPVFRALEQWWLSIRTRWERWEEEKSVTGIAEDEVQSLSWLVGFGEYSKEDK